jgi:ribosome-binding factor A
MATIRQNKVGRLIQKELGNIFLREGYGNTGGVMITVTIVRMSPDLSFAKVYLSVFPSKNAEASLEHVKLHASQIRGSLGKKVGKQLRIVPELAYYIDDSLDYAARINELLS